MQAQRTQQKNTLILSWQKRILFLIPQGQPKQSWPKTLNTVNQAYTYSYIFLKYKREMWAQIFHIFFFFLTASSKNDPFKSHEQIFEHISMQVLVLLKWVEPPAILLFTWLIIRALHSLMEIHKTVWSVLNLIMVNELLW